MTVVQQRQTLKCPRCNYRLIDSGVTTSSILYVMEVVNELYVDYFAKCKRCRIEVGIKKINKY